MSLLQQLRDDALAARKAAVERKPEGLHATFLATVLSDALSYAKTAQREVSDADAEQAVRSNLKKLRTLLDGNPDKGVTALPADSEYAGVVRAQFEALDGYVPKALHGEELGYAIREAAVEAEVEIDMKAMGKIMAILNAKYPGQIEGAEVKALILKGV